MNKHAYVICRGFLGDSLWGSLACEQLVVQKIFDEITYVVKFPQTIEVLQENPYIAKVISLDTFLRTNIEPNSTVFELPFVDLSKPPTIELQQYVGIQNPVLSYKVHVPEHADVEAQQYIKELRDTNPGQPIVAYMRNWYDKGFEYTEEEYWIGKDVPDMGYGGRKRNIQQILDTLKNHCVLVPVGLDDKITLEHPDSTQALYTKTAAILKNADWFIGAEGGLSNLASGVGTKCIVTVDLIHMLYGPNGLFSKRNVVPLGPTTFFPHDGHIHIDPYATDEEVALTIKDAIQ